MSVFELQTGDSINAFDQGFSPETPPNPDAFDEGTGPSRFTIWIPSEQVVVNMGNPVHGATVSGKTATENESAAVAVDRGFVVQTDNHVHFHTFGVATSSGTPPNEASGVPAANVEAGVRTVVRLGVPGLVPLAGSAYGSTNVNFTGSPLSIGSVYPPALNQWNGYALISEGTSYQEAAGPSAVVAGEQDLRLAGNTAVLVGSPGFVHIAADTSAGVSDFARNNGSDSDYTSGSQWRTFNPTEHAIDLATGAFTGLLGVGVAVDALFHSQYGRSPMPGKVGWALDGFDHAALWAGFGAAGAALGLGLYAGLSSESPGTVAIYGSSSFKSYGTVTAGMHGGVAATVSSLVVSLLSSLGIVSISSGIIVNISSDLVTKISGLMSASMTSQFGTAKVNGKTSAELSSAGKVFVGGQDDVQINSTDGRLFAHGAKSFYLGTGAGTSPITGVWPLTSVEYVKGEDPGWGLIGDPQQGLKIGRMSHAADFANAWGKSDDATQMIMDAQGVRITSNGHTLSFAKDAVQIDGKRIQLG